jgi:P-type Cu+ transporter
MSTAHVTLEIFGLACAGDGAPTIERALRSLRGVVHAYVNLATETAYVEYDAAMVSPDDLVAVVERVGFRAGAPILR